MEIDGTYYGPPSATTVMRWRDGTPPDFIFAAKVPQAITREKMLVGCQLEFKEFFETMSILGDKLGPLVFQFPRFDRWKFSKQEDFLSVLRPFLRQLPSHEFAIEIRNKAWLNASPHVCQFQTVSTEGFTPESCAKTVPESNVFNLFELSLSEKQIPRFVGNVGS